MSNIEYLQASYTAGSMLSLAQKFGLKETLSRCKELEILESITETQVVDAVLYFGVDSLEVFDDFDLTASLEIQDWIKIIDYFGQDDVLKKFGNMFGGRLSSDELSALIDYYGAEIFNKIIYYFDDIQKIIVEMAKVRPDILSKDEVISSIDQNGFAMGYHLLQSYLGSGFSFDDESMDSFIPGDGGVINDSIYNFYYHDKSFDNKIAFVLYGTDHNGALIESFLPHVLYKSGYNVLVEDGRGFDRVAKIKDTKYATLGEFVEGEKIPFYSGKLDAVFINVHGSAEGLYSYFVEGGHVLQILDPKSQQPIVVSTSNLITSITDPIDHPVKILMISCHGWRAAENTIDSLPEGSEILAFGKYREVDGSEEIDSYGTTGGRVFEKALSMTKSLNVRDGNTISVKDIALIHSLIKIEDATSGSVLYAKKHASGNSKIMCKDEGAILQTKCIHSSVISKFVDSAVISKLKELCEEANDAEDCELEEVRETLEGVLNAEEPVEHLDYYDQNLIEGFGCWLAFEHID